MLKILVTSIHQNITTKYNRESAAEPNNVESHTTEK